MGFFSSPPDFTLVDRYGNSVNVNGQGEYIEEDKDGNQTYVKAKRLFSSSYVSKYNDENRVKK